MPFCRPFCAVHQAGNRPRKIPETNSNDSMTAQKLAYISKNDVLLYLYSLKTSDMFNSGFSEIIWNRINNEIIDKKHLNY